MTLRRLAWFTPLPPVRSGISAYSTDVLPTLSERFDIDVFVDGAHPEPWQPAWGLPAPTAVLSAHDFVWRQREAPYDLVVYQLGNATCHDYMWAYLTRYPGLVILHDGQLHHARARQLLTRARASDYRAEFKFCHPDARPEFADYGVAGFGGPLYYFWPMLGIALTAARLVAVHSPTLADDLREEFPGAEILTIRMGVPDLTAEEAPRLPQASSASLDSVGGDRVGPGASVRARHGIDPDELLFVAFGVVTAEKRITQALDALPAVLRHQPRARLLLVGEPKSHFDARTEIRARELTDRVIATGFVPQAELPAYLDAADVCLCMRWPSTRETSASWLRCLAAAKPTIVTDLVHTVDVPSVDARTWEVLHASVDPWGAGSRGVTAEPICVSVDILDEDHSLRLAMRRLAVDPDLRHRLGRAARVFWAGGHKLSQMTADYLDAIDLALGRPLPALDRLPPHLHRDGTALVRRLLNEVGLSVDLLGVPSTHPPGRNG